MCACLITGPSGFNAAKDTQDSYQFVYPFGWQEVSVDGTDVVYKDIIEPLESASVTISKTDKQSITEFGNPLEVSRVLCKATSCCCLLSAHHEYVTARI